MFFYWWILIGIIATLLVLWLVFGNNPAVRALPLHINTPLQLAHSIAFSGAPYPPENLDHLFDLDQKRAGVEWARTADTPLSFHAPIAMDLTPQIPPGIAPFLAPAGSIPPADIEPKYFQRLTHRVAERVFGIPFQKDLRPPWLLNPKTGQPLELDMYNAEHKLAIEYNGYQHYVFPNKWCPKTPEGKAKYEAGRERDAIKRDLCDQLGIYLIEVPYNIHTFGPDAEKHIETWLRYLAPMAVEQRKEAAARGVKPVGGPETPWAIRELVVQLGDETEAPPPARGPWARVGDPIVTTHGIDD